MSDINFKTQDINLAVYLKTKNIRLLNTNSLGPYRAEFIFEPVSQELLNQWLTTEATAPLRLAINEYRHLIREARQAETGVCGGRQ